MAETRDQITIKELGAKEEILQAYTIAKQRYAGLTKESFEQQISEMIEMNDFKMIGAFLNDELVGITGYWILRMLYCGRYIQISSFIVDEEKRGLGIGKKLMRKIEEIGLKLSCEKIILDSYTENKNPIRFTTARVFISGVFTL